jgi:hypothetical protein
LAYLVFYSALFVWYMGIVIDFYVSYSQWGKKGVEKRYLEWRLWLIVYL